MISTRGVGQEGVFGASGLLVLGHIGVSFDY